MIVMEFAAISVALKYKVLNCFNKICFIEYRIMQHFERSPFYRTLGWKHIHTNFENVVRREQKQMTRVKDITKKLNEKSATEKLNIIHRTVIF